MRGLIFVGMLEPDSHNPEERAFVEALSASFSVTYYLRGVGIKGLRPHSVRSIPSRLWGKPASSPSSSPALPGGGRLGHGSLIILPMRRLARGLNARWLARQLDRIVVGWPDDWTLWIRFPSPELVAALDRVLVGRTVYEPIDLYRAAEDLSTGEAARLAAAESRLVRRSTVITGGRLLAQRFAGAAGGSTCLPFGLDLAHADVRTGFESALPHPRIGLVGCLDWRVDEALLVSVARAHPEWQLLLAGPRVGRWGRSLLRLPNVHWFGRIPVDRVPGFIRGLDVALIPYRQTAWTRHALPVKVFEYLAQGKPVVTTPLPELELVDGAVSITSPESFALAIGQALRDDDPRLAEMRRRTARRFTLQDRARRAVQGLARHQDLPALPRQGVGVGGMR